MYARDVSNFTDLLTPETIQQWKSQGVGLVIIQAFPPSYRQYAEQRDQMRLCASQGLEFDCYIYDYLGDPGWLAGALDGLARAEAEGGLKPRQLWLDEEDVTSEHGWSAQQRIDAITRSYQKTDEYTNAHGIQRAGYYTGAWWHIPKTDNTTAFADRDLWDADYDNQADTEQSWSPYGGWTQRRIKQYAGSQPDGTDLNVLSVEEEAEVTQGEPDVPIVVPTDQPEIDQGWQDKKDTVVQLAGELKAVADQIESAAKRRNGPRKSDVLPLANEVRARADAILA